MSHDPKQANFFSARRLDGPDNFAHQGGGGGGGAGAWPPGGARRPLAPEFIRATAGEPEPPAAPPGVELRVNLIAALVSRSILDTQRAATASDVYQLRVRLRRMSPAFAAMTPADVAAFLAWASRALADCCEPGA